MKCQVVLAGFGRLVGWEFVCYLAVAEQHTHTKKDKDELLLITATTTTITAHYCYYYYYYYYYYYCHLSYYNRPLAIVCTAGNGASGLC